MDTYVTFKSEELFQFFGEVALPPWPHADGEMCGSDVDCAPIASKIEEWVEEHKLGVNHPNYYSENHRPTPSEMMLLLNMLLSFNGYILTTWNWEKLDWGTYDGKEYVNHAKGRLLNPVTMTSDVRHKKS